MATTLRFQPAVVYNTPPTHQRRRLVVEIQSRSEIVRPPAPGDLEFPDVVSVDLIERRSTWCRSNLRHSAATRRRRAAAPRQAARRSSRWRGRRMLLRQDDQVGWTLAFTSQRLAVDGKAPRRMQRGYGLRPLSYTSIRPTRTSTFRGTMAEASSQFQLAGNQWRDLMKTRATIVGIAVTCAALAVPAPVAAQAGSAAKRVEPFTHLTAPAGRARRDHAGRERDETVVPQSSRRVPEVLGLHGVLCGQLHDSIPRQGDSHPPAPPGCRAATTSGGGTTSGARRPG